MPTGEEPAEPCVPVAPSDEVHDAEVTALKGEKWTNGKELTARVKDIALGAGKRAVVKIGSGSYKKFTCSSEQPCPWFINAVCSRPKKDVMEGRRGRYWYVTSASLTHSPECDSVPRPTTRQLKESILLRDAVYADARVSSVDLVAQLEASQAFQCSKSMVYKAKTDLLEAMEAARRNGDAVPEVVESMQKLPGYMQQLRTLNAHVATVIETEDETTGSCFEKALLALDPTGVWNNQSILGIDSVEMEHTSYNGTMLVLIGRDGDLQPLLHAAALVPEGSLQNCLWFLEKLMQHGFPLRRFPMVINGCGELGSACSVLRLTHVMLCTRQLLKDMRDTLGVALEEDDEALVWQAQRAEAESEYLASVAQLSRQNEAAGQYIRGLEPTKWCLYPYLAVRKMYGWQTTRFEEMDLGTGTLGLAPAKKQLPYECFKVLALVAMHAAFQRHERATQWELERRVVTPEAERLMQEQLARVQLYSVCMSSAQLAFVWNSQKPQIRQRRVDLEHRTCTCSRRLQWGIPCRHVLAALQKLGEMDRAVEFFDECYLVRNYVSSFKDRALELPVDDNIELDTTLRPPRYVNKQSSNDADSNANSKQKKRRKRNLPLNQRKRPMYKCHKCNRAEGHNKGTCPY
ncbi:hypothetical protein P3T76_005616 [Phytophthora citrophthora]|uniref:SWIM-type domain-containing protein n=1 Tax=Phytophthora citrophthora TaxID=4793 RepID=A0AAD9GR07_9STRA|nr:hypothetical protein P3T76_005616 [Phytophthora citrophthora]